MFEALPRPSSGEGELVAAEKPLPTLFHCFMPSPHGLPHGGVLGLHGRLLCGVRRRRGRFQALAVRLGWRDRRRSGTGRELVHPAIAVVVDTVAGLVGARVNGAIGVVAVTGVGGEAYFRPTAKLLCDGATHFIAVDIAVVGVFHTFVYRAITVVVDTVADLGRGGMDFGLEIITIPYLYCPPVRVEVARRDREPNRHSESRSGDTKQRLHQAPLGFPSLFHSTSSRPHPHGDRCFSAKTTLYPYISKGKERNSIAHFSPFVNAIDF